MPGKRACPVWREAGPEKDQHRWHLAARPTLLRVTPRQGGRESRPQGEGAQVLRSETTVRYA